MSDLESERVAHVAKAILKCHLKPGQVLGADAPLDSYFLTLASVALKADEERAAAQKDTLMNNSELHLNTVDWLLKTAGVTISNIDSFEMKIVVLESVVAAIIADACVRHNRQPEETVEVFCQGVKSRIDSVIYGRKQ